MTAELFPGLSIIEVRVKDGKIQVGAWSPAGDSWDDMQWHNLGLDQLTAAANKLCDLMDEAYPLDPDDDGVTPNFNRCCEQVEPWHGKAAVTP